MNNKVKVQRILARMNKAGDNVYDGLTSNAPAMQPASNIVDTYRAMEAADITNPKEKFFIDNLELSRRIMEIDNKYYNILDDTAHELLDYLEQQNFEGLAELEMEYQAKKKEMKKRSEELAQLNIDDYLTEEDYKRVISYKIRQLRIYQNRLEYLKAVIRTIKDFQKELEIESTYPQDTIFRNNASDFAYSFTNQNSDITGAAKLK